MAEMEFRLAHEAELDRFEGCQAAVAALDASQPAAPVDPIDIEEVWATIPLRRWRGCRYWDPASSPEDPPDPAVCARHQDAIDAALADQGPSWRAP